MDDAVLGLVWVTSVCIVGHIASAFYFQRVLTQEATHIDEKIEQIDVGIASVAQWMFEKFDNPASQTVGIDWGSIINQLFNQNSPNNLNMIPNEFEVNGAQTWIDNEEEELTPQE